MTLSSPPRQSGKKTPTSLEKLVARYGTQTLAAQTWRVSQSAVSRLLSGDRGRRASETLRAIARVEGVSVDGIELPPSRRLTVMDRAGALARFVYDLDDPQSMLLQVQNWFADLPSDTRMRDRVVKAVMRALFDESFDSVHRPTRQWDAVMRYAEGWVASSTGTSKGGGRR